MEHKLWLTMSMLLLNVVGFAIMLGGIIALQSTCKGKDQPEVKATETDLCHLRKHRDPLAQIGDLAGIWGWWPAGP